MGNKASDFRFHVWSYRLILKIAKFPMCNTWEMFKSPVPCVTHGIHVSHLSLPCPCVIHLSQWLTFSILLILGMLKIICSKWRINPESMKMHIKLNFWTSRNFWLICIHLLHMINVAILAKNVQPKCTCMGTTLSLILCRLSSQTKNPPEALVRAFGSTRPPTTLTLMSFELS